MAKSKKRKSNKKKSVAKSKNKFQLEILQNRNWLIGAFILLIVGFASYYPSLENGFTNWDDEVYVVNNDMLINLDLGRIFKEPVSANYHPITMLSLGLNYQSSGLNPYGYHLTNMVIHVLNIILVFFLFFYFSRKNLSVAFITAFVFGIHPMHVESVTWISERKDVLYAFFFVAGMISYLRYLRQADKRFLWMALILFLLSCLSKAMAVVFPVVLLLMDWWEDRDIKQKNVWIEKIPFFVLSFIFGILAVKVQSEGGAVGSYETFALHHRFMFAGYGFLMYIYKFLVPIDLSTFYPYPNLGEGGFLPSIYYAAPIIALGFAGITWYFGRRWKPLLFGIGFYFLTVALVLQFMSVGQVVMADRYTYLPYIGLGFLLGCGFSHFWEGESKNPIGYILAGIISLGFLWFTYGTYERSKVWKNSETLWTNVIDQHPNVGLAYKNRGNYRARNGKIEEALKDFNIALQLLPDDSAIYESLGNTYAGMGQIQQALGYYNSAIELDDSKSSAFLNRGIALSQLRQYDQAFADYQKALDMGQRLLSVLPNRGYAYLDAGMYQESIADYQKVIQLNPNEGSYYFFLARAFQGIGDQANAQRYMQEAQARGYNPG
ncbi:MAG: tetratricopeptide repeat protein [Bacteroidota bacterium]